MLVLRFEQDFVKVVVFDDEPDVAHPELRTPISEHRIRAVDLSNFINRFRDHEHQSTQNTSLTTAPNIVPLLSHAADNEGLISSQDSLIVIERVVLHHFAQTLTYQDIDRRRGRKYRLLILPPEFPQSVTSAVDTLPGRRMSALRVPLVSSQSHWQRDALTGEANTGFNFGAIVGSGPISKLVECLTFFVSFLGLADASVDTHETAGYPGDREYSAAQDLLASGNFVMAQMRLQETLKIQQTVLGIDHIRTAATLNSMGIASTKMEKYEQALEFYERALLIMEASSRRRSVAAADIIDNIGRMNVALGNYDTAIMRFQEAKGIKTEILGPSHPKLAESEGSLGEVCFEMASFNSAVIHYREGLRICKGCFGREHLATAQMMEDLARTYDSLGEHYAALEFYQEVVGIKLGLMKDHSETVDALHNMAVTLQKLGFYDLAMKLFDQALAIYKRGESKDARKIANTFKSMSVVHSKQRHYSKAIDSLKQALLIEGREFGLENLNTANTFNNLGVAYGNIGNYKEAIRLYEIALNITKRFRPHMHVDVGDIHHNIGMAWFVQGREHHEDAREHFCHSYRSFVAALGADNVKTQKARELLESIVLRPAARITRVRNRVRGKRRQRLLRRR